MSLFQPAHDKALHDPVHRNPPMVPVWRSIAATYFWNRRRATSLRLDPTDIIICSFGDILLRFFPISFLLVIHHFVISFRFHPPPLRCIILPSNFFAFWAPALNFQATSSRWKRASFVYKLLQSLWDHNDAPPTSTIWKRLMTGYRLHFVQRLFSLLCFLLGKGFKRVSERRKWIPLRESLPLKR